MLLRNEGDVLPLRQGLERVLVIGQHADQGVLAGGGSSAVTPVRSLVLSGADVMGLDTPKVYHPSSPLHAIRAESGAAHVDFLDGTDRDAAVAAARDADAVVLIVDEWRSEGLDAAGLGMPDGQEELIAALARTTDRLVVVVESGGPVALPWADDVPAVIAAFYPGSGGGPALAGVLFGRVNPSGHLPVTFPRDVAQLPRPEQKDPATTTSNPGEPRKGEVFTVDYDIEGSDVGYRWFDRESHTPGFPFGHGLSYTSFAFSDLAVHVEGAVVTVDVTVTNTGARAARRFRRSTSRGRPTTPTRTTSWRGWWGSAVSTSRRRSAGRSASRSTRDSSHGGTSPPGTSGSPAVTGTASASGRMRSTPPGRARRSCSQLVTWRAERTALVRRVGRTGGAAPGRCSASCPSASRQRRVKMRRVSTSSRGTST